MKTLTPDPVDRADAIPFVGHVPSFTPPAAPSGRVTESRGFLLILIVSIVVTHLLSRLAGADPGEDPLEDEGITVAIGGGEGGASRPEPEGEPTETETEEAGAVEKAVGSGTLREPGKPNRNGLSQGTQRQSDAIIPRKTAPVRTFRIGDQLPGREPVEQGSIGDKGVGQQAGKVRVGGGIGALLPGGDTRASSGPPASSLPGSGSGTAPVGRVSRGVSVADLVEASRNARPVGGGEGMSQADRVALASATILRHASSFEDARVQDGWLVRHWGNRTCALSEQDRTIVCADESGDHLVALVGGQRASSFATTQAALELLARLVTR